MAKKESSAPSSSVSASTSAAPESVAERKSAAKSPQLVPAVEMGARQREISVSFFTKNRHLLGFDNPRKAFLTCVKEAVDNALDASEEAGILPDVMVRLEVVPTGGVTPPASQATRFRVTVTDNGPGIVRQHIPRIFAKLLYGSKFHRMRMSRGQQGIGISAAGMYGQLTTGKPVQIISRTGPKAAAHYFEVQIDTKKNEPLVHENKQIAWDRPQGTQVTLEVEGKDEEFFSNYERFGSAIMLLFLGTSIYFASGQIPMNIDVTHQIVPDDSFADARWASNITGTMFRGWLQYSIEKGILGRRITITGTWGTDDGNFTGDFILKNLILFKFHGTYQGVFLAEVSGLDYTGRFVGFFRNGWEVGYWKTIIPAKMQIQIVHIPFN